MACAHRCVHLTGGAFVGTAVVAIGRCCECGEEIDRYLPDTKGPGPHGPHGDPESIRMRWRREMLHEHDGMLP